MDSNNHESNAAAPAGVTDPMPGSYTVHIAGLKFRKGAIDRWGEIGNGERLLLEPEPTNTYDPYAVKVLIPIDKFHLGYVPKFLAPRICGACNSPNLTVRCVAKFGKLNIEVSEKDAQAAVAL